MRRIKCGCRLHTNTLGAGAGFNTKELVEALIEAERAPKEAIIREKIDSSEAQAMPWRRLWLSCQRCETQQGHLMIRPTLMHTLCLIL